MALVIGFALAAALCNAVSSILQKQGAQGVPTRTGSGLGFVAGLVRQPVWILGILAMVGSFLLQAAALANGELATVQPVMASELLFVLVILVVWFRQRLGRQEWLGAGGLVVGVGGFLLASAPSGGRDYAGTLAWVVTGVIASVIILGAAQLGRVSYGPRPAMYFGVAAAVTFAVTAALVKVVVDTLTHHGIVALMTSWTPYALAITGAIAVILAGKAFERGSVAAAQAAFCGIDPLASIVIGIGLFGEHLRSGPVAIALGVISLAIMMSGVVLLSNSPMVFRAERLPTPARRRLRLRGRQAGQAESGLAEPAAQPAEHVKDSA